MKFWTILRGNSTHAWGIVVTQSIHVCHFEEFTLSQNAQQGDSQYLKDQTEIITVSQKNSTQYVAIVSIILLWHCCAYNYMGISI